MHAAHVWRTASPILISWWAVLPEQQPNNSFSSSPISSSEFLSTQAGLRTWWSRLSSASWLLLPLSKTESRNFVSAYMLLTNFHNFLVITLIMRNSTIKLIFHVGENILTNNSLRLFCQTNKLNSSTLSGHELLNFRNSAILVPMQAKCNKIKICVRKFPHEFFRM